LLEGMKNCATLMSSPGSCSHPDHHGARHRITDFIVIAQVSEERDLLALKDT